MTSTFYFVNNTELLARLQTASLRIFNGFNSSLNKWHAHIERKKKSGNLLALAKKVCVNFAHLARSKVERWGSLIYVLSFHPRTKIRLLELKHAFYFFVKCVVFRFCFLHFLSNLNLCIFSTYHRFGLDFQSIYPVFFVCNDSFACSIAGLEYSIIGTHTH